MRAAAAAKLYRLSTISCYGCGIEGGKRRVVSVRRRAKREKSAWTGFAGALLIAVCVNAPMPRVAAEDDAAAKSEAARRELEMHQQQLKQMKAQQRGVERNVTILDEENTRLNQLLIDTARRIQDGEAVLTRIELRLGELSAQEELIRGSLAQRHDKIAGLLAAMQRIGRQPPPVIVTHRDDALKMVRSAMLLSSFYPQLRNQADELATKLTDLMRVTSDIRLERDRRRHQGDMLQANRASIGKLIAEKRAQFLARKSQLANLEGIIAANEKSVATLEELIAKLDKEIEAKSRLGEYQEKLAQGKGDGGEKRTAFLDPGRIEPAVAFGKTVGALPLPVSGKKMRSFGDNDGLGGSSKGIVLETRGEAQVTAPCDGWVVYAGNFRSYGNLLILNAGGGYHILLAGMERIDVSLGQFVLAGEPVGQMARKDEAAEAERVAAADKRPPALYIEFRKDGRPINPDPWWVVG
jgi:septal ring factor EnvC (AmiA/AmiB activator)